MMNDLEDEMDEIEALLPWYAAGTLDSPDAKRVEEALVRRSDLRASLDLIREDREETITLNERLGSPNSAVLARVLATAKAEPRKPSLFARLTSLVGAGAGGSPVRLAWAGAAAAVVIVLQAATIVTLLHVTKGSGDQAAAGPGFATASGPDVAVEGANVLVTFAPDARMDQVGAWLLEHQAAIVDGPRGGGMYRLRVGDKVPTPDEMAKLLAELGTAPIVRMVLPTGDK